MVNFTFTFTQNKVTKMNSTAQLVLNEANKEGQPLDVFTMVWLIATTEQSASYDGCIPDRVDFSDGSALAFDHVNKVVEVV